MFLALTFSMALNLTLACDAPKAQVQSAPFELGERICLSGQVTDVLDAGSYTYLGWLDDEGEQRWLATLSSSTIPALGSQASFVQLGERQDFHSARLERDFSRLGFGFSGPC